jgi:hypothetical protein
MKLVWPAFFALTAFTVAALLATRTPAAAPAAVGPGVVLDMHRRFFAALDAGDAEKALAFVDTSSEGGFADGEDGGIARPDVMWLDEHGLPEHAHGLDAVRGLVARHAKASVDGGPAWTTKIVKSRSDCYSAELSYAILEFERSRGVKGGTRRYRSTSLVRHAGDQWKLLHFHVSAADAETARLVSASTEAR